MRKAAAKCTKSGNPIARPQVDAETERASRGYLVDGWRKDVKKALRRCLANLTARHTEVIDLVYYRGKTVAEVAGILNLPEATVKTRMFYARRKLAQLVHATGCNNLL
jgi:RNA polymerase sigma factor (sigma-70 family)